MQREQHLQKSKGEQTDIFKGIEPSGKERRKSCREAGHVVF